MPEQLNEYDLDLWPFLTDLLKRIVTLEQQRRNDTFQSRQRDAVLQDIQGRLDTELSWRERAECAASMACWDDTEGEVRSVADLQERFSEQVEAD